MAHEPVIRLAAFLGVFFLIATWELLSPRRQLATPKALRWLANISITVLGTALTRGIFPVLAVTVAAKGNTPGLLEHVHLPLSLKVLTGILALDLIIYLQHVTFHAVPLLWRLHMMHHADLDIDVTTGLRFHPIEVMLSMAIKIAAIVIIGPPVLAVILFEILLNATSMFNHGNIYIPAGVDKFLRLLVVTPDMHRVHHSVVIRETNSNFGFNFPLWDRIFRTYKAQPAAGHKDMVIGLSQFRDRKRLTFPWMLALPFIGNPGIYARNPFARQPVKKS